MARIRRYSRDRVYRGGVVKGTSEVFRILREKSLNGTLRTTRHVTKEDERLDQIAAKKLGDPRLWWAIAVCSGIGWNLQVPPGITLKIPLRSELKIITGN